MNKQVWIATLTRSLMQRGVDIETARKRAEWRADRGYHNFTTSVEALANTIVIKDAKNKEPFQPLRLKLAQLENGYTVAIIDDDDEQCSTSRLIKSDLDVVFELDCVKQASLAALHELALIADGVELERKEME